MNTGEKNLYGRTIYKGSKGGTYVIHAGTGRKIYTFKKAAPVSPGPPKNTKGRIIYKGPKGGLYVLNGTKKVRTFKATNENKARAKASTPPASKKSPVYTKTSYTRYNGIPIYKKNSTGRYFAGFGGRSFVVIAKTTEVVNSRGVRASLGNHLKGKVPATTPPPRTKDRNRRLAEIRARLNAIREKIRVEKPKARENIEHRLRVAYWRARARVNPTRDNLSRKPMKTISIPTCHAPATVPRRACTTRYIDLKVYTGIQPLIQSGGVIAMHEDDFDIDWFNRQNKYISDLSDYDFWTVQAHTNRSHGWIGPYAHSGTIPSLYGYAHEDRHMKPLWPQIRKLILNGTYRAETNWVKDFKAETDENKRYKLYTHNLGSIPNTVKKQALDMYKDDLKRIIAGAPRSKKKMILYRGSHYDIFKSTRGHVHTLKSFCSAAYNVEHATMYGLTFTRITVLPGTPVLLVAGTNQWDYNGEYEVMVNIDTKYLIRARNVTRHVYYGSRRADRGEYKITDVIIAK